MSVEEPKPAEEPKRAAEPDPLYEQIKNTRTQAETWGTLVVASVGVIVMVVGIMPLNLTLLSVATYASLLFLATISAGKTVDCLTKHAELVGEKVTREVAKLLDSNSN